MKKIGTKKLILIVSIVISVLFISVVVLSISDDKRFMLVDSFSMKQGGSYVFDDGYRLYCVFFRDSVIDGCRIELYYNDVLVFEVDMNTRSGWAVQYFGCYKLRFDGVNDGMAGFSLYKK